MGAAEEDAAATIARFAEPGKAAATDSEVRELLSALLTTYAHMADSKWASIVQEFNKRSEQNRNKQWLKRLAEKIAKESAKGPGPDAMVSNTAAEEDSAKVTGTGDIGSRRLLEIGPIYAAQSGLHGLGVFASRPLKKNETIHTAPFRCLDLSTAVAPAAVLNMGDDGVVAVHKVLPKDLQTDLFQGRTDEERCLVLGLGSLFNHADDPTVGYRFDYDTLLCRYWALQDLPAGQELLISYGANYFGQRGMQKKE